MEKQALQRLKREFALLEKSPHPNFVARPSDSDMLTWHYVLFDLPNDSAYAGGQYHGKLVFPREYPLKPPSILMCTPSGRFEVNKRLCLSMSDYHPETWNPSWRVETILLGLVSFMLDESDPATAGGIQSSKAQRKSEALLSFFRNARNKDFKVLFPELCDACRYFPGWGFMRADPKEGSRKSWVDLGLNPQEIESVVTMDDLEAVLSKCDRISHEDQSIKKGKHFTSNVLPLVAIGGLVLVWLLADKG